MIVIAVIILVAALIGAAFLGRQFLPPKKASVTASDTIADHGSVSSPPVEMPVNQSSDDAIHYLDDNAQWEKGKMEKINELKGLWDALNAYDFNKIKTYNISLCGSKRFTEIINAIPNTDKSGTFCGDNDTSNTITVERYISKLKEKPQVESQAPKSNQTKTNSPQNKSQTSPSQNPEQTGSNSRQ